MKNSFNSYLAPICIAGATSAFAQEVIVRSPSQWDAPPAVATLNNAQSELAPLGAPPARPESPLKWGPITFRPHLDFSVTYGDGLQHRPGVQHTTVAETVSPGMLFELGRQWSLDYTPRLTFYSHKDFKDTLAHDVALRGGVKWDEWKFGVAQTYSLSEDPLIETATQTELEVFGTALTASRPLGSKMLLELGAYQSIRYAKNFNNSKSWSTMNWLNYQFAPRLSVAGGLGFCYDDVSLGSDMYSEQVQARVNARVAEKVNLSVNGGVEFRQFQTGSAGDVVNPIYGASVQYRPLEFTTLTLSGSRRIQPSLFAGQITENTDISIAVNQRLIGMFFLTLSGGYAMTDYQDSVGSLATVRSDDGLQFMARLAYSFWKRATASIFYQASDHNSNVPGYTYSSTQIGLNLGYRF